MTEPIDGVDGEVLIQIAAEGDGEWTRRSIVRTDDGYVSVGQSSDFGEDWALDEEGPAADSLQAALDQEPAVLVLRPGNRYRIAGADDAAEMLRSRLSSVTPGAESAPAATAPIPLDGSTFLLLRRDSTGQNVVLACDEEGPKGDTLGSFDWSDDAELNSTTGAGSLVQVLDDFAVAHESMDFEAGFSGIELGATPASRAAGLVEWLQNIAGGPTMAILALEPFDPDSVLDADQREEWAEALADDRWDLTLYLDPETTAVLRRQLVPARVAAAFRNPISDEGQQLLAELEESTFLDTQLQG